MMEQKKVPAHAAKEGGLRGMLKRLFTQQPRCGSRLLQHAEEHLGAASPSATQAQACRPGLLTKSPARTPQQSGKPGVSTSHPGEASAHTSGKILHQALLKKHPLMHRRKASGTRTHRMKAAEQCTHLRKAAEKASQ